MHPLSPAASANTLKSLIMIALLCCIAGNITGTVGNDVSGNIGPCVKEATAFRSQQIAANASCVC